MNKRPAQCQRVIDWLTSHDELTTLEAITEIGVLRLSARISELKDDGFLFGCRWKEITNRYGETCRIKAYKLLKEGKNE